MSLSVLDRIVKSVKPVNALVEKLCERLLPHEDAHAAGICLEDWGCGVKTGDAQGYYYWDGHEYVFLGCGCP